MSAGGAGDGRWDGSGAGAPSGPPLREADGFPPDAATSMFTVPCVRASVLPFLGSPSPGPASPPPRQLSSPARDLWFPLLYFQVKFPVPSPRPPSALG